MRVVGGRWIGLAGLVGLVAVAGCGPGPVAPVGPAPCHAVYSADRCDAILTAAAEQAGIAEDEILALEIRPDPPPPPGGALDRAGPVVRLTIRTAAGPADLEIFCGGIAGATDPPCMESPRLVIGGIGDGYHDVPCPGEPPHGCATPLPDLAPEALAAARPLRLDRFVIPVARVGPHEVVVGRASLANGVLRALDAALVEPWPAGLDLSREGLRLEVRSLDPDRPPFRTYYEHGWWPGTEEVELVLAFEVRDREPGATIVLRDVVVE